MFLKLMHKFSVNLLNFPILTLFLIVCSITHAENVPDSDGVVGMLISQQMIYEQCQTKFPVQMNQLYGSEQNALEALDKADQFDEHFKHDAQRILNAYDHQKIVQIKVPIRQQVSVLINSQSNLCDIFLKRKVGNSFFVHQILYSPITGDFYLKIHDQWFNANLEGYDLLDCECEQKNKLSEQQKLRRKLDFINKVKSEIKAVSSFYMSPDQYEKLEANILIYIGTKEAQSYTPEKPDENITAESLAQAIVDQSESQEKDEDLGLGYRNVRVYRGIPELNTLESLVNSDVELSYECELNYRDNSETTCFKELIPLK